MPPARLANCSQASEPRGVWSAADRSFSSTVPPRTKRSKVTQQPGHLLQQHHPSQHRSPALGFLAQVLTLPDLPYVQHSHRGEGKHDEVKTSIAHRQARDAHCSSLHAVELLSLVSSQRQALLQHLMLSPLWLLLFQAHLFIWLQSGRAAPSLLQHHSDPLPSKARNFTVNISSSRTGKGSGTGKRGRGDYSSLASLYSALCVRRKTHYGLLLFLQF